jgi:hypothetical protein
MNKRLFSFLRDLAKTRGQMFYQSEGGNQRELAIFQSEIDEIRDLERAGLLEIIGTPHRESMSGHSYIDLIKIELTSKGVRWVSDQGSETQLANDPHLDRLGRLFNAVNGSQDSFIDLSDVLKDEQMDESDVWNEANYMEGEKWVTIEVDEAPVVRLTHRGIKTAEIHLARTTHSLDSETRPYRVPNIEDHRELRVFLCHSSDDKPAVRDLYEALSSYKGINPWLDEIDLLPGQDWDLEIRKAVKRADIILVCLSQASVNKKGYIQKEIKYALDVADEQPEGSIFLIPLRLEECVVPDRLTNRQWVDYFKPRGHQQLLSALRSRAKEIGVTFSVAAS